MLTQAAALKSFTALSESLWLVRPELDRTLGLSTVLSSLTMRGASSCEGLKYETSASLNMCQYGVVRAHLYIFTSLSIRSCQAGD